MDSLPKSLQDLEPADVRLCLNVENFANSKTKQPFARSNVLVGVSGGADSTALLIIATLLCRKSGGRVFCAHINHKLRKEADFEEAFVSSLCNQLNVTFLSKSVNLKKIAESQKVGLEEAGRNIRYDFFNKCVQKYNLDLILTAHHLGDLSEDVVMRLLRGAGWPALGGMQAYDSKRKLLRPLLNVSKHKIISFLQSLQIDWCEDLSNQSDLFTRNRVRKNIIPILNKENRSLEETIARLNTQADMDQNFWESEINRFLENVVEIEKNVFLAPRSFLNNVHPSLRCRIYKVLLEKLGSGHILSESILLLEKGFNSGQGGKKYQFSGSKVALVSNKGIIFKLI